MKLLFKQSSHIAAVSLVSALTFSPAVSAYDTDIYFSNASGAGSANSHGKQPNVLFIMDTSGSMTAPTSDGVSRLAVMQDALSQIVDSAQNINMGLMRFSYNGGPVVYPVADLNADAGLVELQQTNVATPVIPKGPFTATSTVSSSNADAKEVSSGIRLVALNDVSLPAFSESAQVPTNKTISVKVPTNNDDGIEQVGINRHGSMSALNWSHLYMPTWTHNTTNATLLTLAGLRFTNLDIPQGSTITDARIRLTASETRGGTARYRITIDDKPLSLPFRSGASDGLTREAPGIVRDDTIDKNVGVNWNLGRIDRNNVYSSPQIKSLLQRVVSDPTWNQANNAVSLFMWPRFQNSRYKRKRFYSREDGNTARHPELVVSYGGTSTVTIDHTLGFKFEDLRVPQGAKVLSAKLHVAAAETSNAVTDMKIYAQNADDAAAFSASNGNISSRGTTSAVNWQLTAAEGWIEGDFYESPDLAGIVQTVVDRTGWCGGNDAALILDGSGGRKIASYDRDPALAAKLVITYENDFSGSETGCTVDETSYQISTSSGDADENNSTSSVNTGSTNVRFGSSHWAGFNFTGIRAPKDSQIESATLELSAHQPGSGTVLIKAHDTDSSANFSSTPDNISSRPRTSASTTWTLNASTAGDALNSPNFSNVISEIVQRPGWSPGGNVSVILQRQSGDVRVKSFEQNVFDSARLKLRYQYDLVQIPDGASGITVRQRLKQVINQLPARGGTPATDTLHEAIRYLRGDTVGWGSQRVPSWIRNNYNNYNFGTQQYVSSFRTSIPASYSPLTANVSMRNGCPGRDSDNTDCGTEHINASPLPKYVTPIVNSCQNTFVVLLSDGEPNTLEGESAIGTLTGKTCNSDTSCGENLAEYMSTKDLLTTGLPGDQTATLHTIGLNINSAYLETLAQKGGGNYYQASDTQSLLDAFKNIVGVAVSKPQTFAAPSVALSAYNRLQTGSNLYYSMFLPHVSRQWNGNVKHYQVSADVEDIVGQNDEKAFENGNVRKEVQSFWSNSGTIDGDKVDSGGFGERLVTQGHNNRKIYTYTGATPPNNSVIVTGSNEFDRGNARLLLLPNWSSGLSLFEKRDLIDWARGKDLDDSDGDGQLADTRWVFGDALHSQPVSVTYDGGSDPDKSSDDTVRVFVGTNAGFIHAIDASSGDELWSFMPPEMLSVQKDLREDLQGTHIFGVDGRIRAWVNDANRDGDIRQSDGDQVILYVTFGRGARAMYALDVTSANNPKILWRIDNNTPGFANLGETWSRPVVSKMSVAGTEKDILIFGGGYDPIYDAPAYNGGASIGRGVYIVDAVTGQKILWISSDGSADLTVASMNSAIPSDIRAADVVGPDGLIDRLYFGDLLGRMWRVDLEQVGVRDPGQSIAHLVADLNGPGDEAGRRFFQPPLVVPFADKGETPTYLFLLMVSGDIHNPLYKQTRNAAFAIKDTFSVLDRSDMPALLTLVKGEDNAKDGILDVTRYSNSDRPEDLPNGYYFNLVADGGSTAGDTNVGRVGLQSGQVYKDVDGDAIDYVWSFGSYDPSRNNTTSAEACSSSVVGETITYGVYLKDGFPVESSDDDCASCTSPPGERIMNLPPIQGIAPPPVEASTDEGADSRCLVSRGFTIISPLGEGGCSGANTYNTYWWRSR